MNSNELAAKTFAKIHVLVNAAGETLAFQDGETVTVMAIAADGVGEPRGEMTKDAAREEWRKALAFGYVWVRSVFASVKEAPASAPVRHDLCVGDKVTGTYHGVPFAGIMADNGGSYTGLMVRLPKGNEIVVCGSVRDGLWITFGSDEHSSLTLAA